MPKILIVITEPEGRKFIIPRDENGAVIEKKVADAEGYCKEKYGGRLARSSGLEDWKNIDSRRLIC